MANTEPALDAAGAIDTVLRVMGDLGKVSAMLDQAEAGQRAAGRLSERERDTYAALRAEIARRQGPGFTRPAQ